MNKDFFKTTKILDGGMGQELLARGMKPKGTLWSANALVDEKYHNLILNIHNDFIKSGADVIVTTTFTTRKKRLKENGLEDQFKYLNEKACGFAQFNYTTDKMNLYGMGGLSSIEYSYQDWFTVEQELVKADPIQTYQLKGGVMYDVNPDVNVFFNTGLVEKAPILDNVIDYSGNVATDPDNEKFLHNEFGVNYRFGLTLGICVAFIGLIFDNLIRTWVEKRKKHLGIA